MNKKKLELITLIIISLVVVAVTLFNFVFNVEGIGFPLESIFVILGLLTYMVFSILSFQRFSKKIGILNDDLEKTQQQLSDCKKNQKTLEEKLEKANDVLASKNKEISDYQRRIEELENSNE